MQPSIRLGRNSQSPFVLAQVLRAAGYPLEQVCINPISAIETMALPVRGTYRGACAVRCGACCANAAFPGPDSKLVVLSPSLFASFLRLAEELAKSGAHIISTGRLNLFSASNELDYSNAIVIRRMLSDYTLNIYGVPLGSFSSDIVFHISKSPSFIGNLAQAMSDSTTWDMACIAIDEQVTFGSSADYSRYLCALRNTWDVLAPALEGSLDHARPDRRGLPRVILNLLIPGPGDAFRPQYAALYDGGPPRATTYSELLERYVTPFIGHPRMVEDAPTRSDHIYPTYLAELGQAGRFRAYVGYHEYARYGRAGTMIRFGKNMTRASHPVIRSKLVPTDDHSIQIYSAYASGYAAEDEIPATLVGAPLWFTKLRDTVIDLSNI